MSKFSCIIVEKFDFEVKFDMDLGRHPRRPRSPCTVITLRGRTLLKEALLLGQVDKSTADEHQCQVAVSSVTRGPGRGLQEVRLGADFVSFY